LAGALAGSHGTFQAMAERSKAPRRGAIDVFRYLDYRVFLADYYAARKPRGFSYRAFSRDAGLGAPNYLKLVIAGRRNLTDAMAERFASAVGLQGDAAHYFGELVRFTQAKNATVRTASHDRLMGFRRYRRAHKLELAHAAYHSNWYLPAIRELAASPAFRDDPAWIASALWPPIKPLEAKQAVQVLVELGLLDRDADGTLRQREAVVSTGPETAGMHITNYHAEMLRCAARSMQLVPAAQRDISSLTFCLGPAGLQRLKKRIQEFRRELIELAEAETEPSQVVQLNFQLFPLSQPTAAALTGPKASSPVSIKEKRHV
jgi:uncharacterized protein (TIGR02147 family)